MRVILASASPRRRELLQMIFSRFDVIPSHKEEVLPEGIDPLEGPQLLAAQKARDIASSWAQAHPEDEAPLVIGCDTAVFLEREMFGKPKDREDAFRMLRLLSGRQHRVITGVCLIQGEREYAFSDLTEVEFYPLSDAEINSWLDMNQYADKAGSYAIQGKSGLMVRSICGDYDNVIGLPVPRLAREIIYFLQKKEDEL